jgi:hypothetical protein
MAPCGNDESLALYRTLAGFPLTTKTPGILPSAYRDSLTRLS